MTAYKQTLLKRALGIVLVVSGFAVTEVSFSAPRTPFMEEFALPIIFAAVLALYAGVVLIFFPNGEVPGTGGGFDPFM